MDGVLKFSNDGVYMVGRDFGGMGKIVAQNSSAIVIKWPAGTHWDGVGMDRSYHSATNYVFQIVEEIDMLWGTKGLKVISLISWENSRKAQK